MRGFEKEEFFVAEYQKGKKEIENESRKEKKRKTSCALVRQLVRFSWVCEGKDGSRVEGTRIRAIRSAKGKFSLLSWLS